MAEFNYLKAALDYLNHVKFKQKYSPEFKELVAKRVVELLESCEAVTENRANSVGHVAAYESLTKNRDDLALNEEIKTYCLNNQITLHGASMLIRGCFLEVYAKIRGAVRTPAGEKPKALRLPESHEGGQRSTRRIKNLITEIEKGNLD